MLQAIADAQRALLDSLRRLSDDELLSRLKGLAARERRATALLVAHLAELETRDVYLRLGYSSLFSYCREVLALSEHEALNRIHAARAARRFPLILDLLDSGAVNLTTLRLLSPHLTAENHAGVLESARGKSKGEVEEIAAKLSPSAGRSGVGPEAAAAEAGAPCSGRGGVGRSGAGLVAGCAARAFANGSDRGSSGVRDGHRRRGVAFSAERSVSGAATDSQITAVRMPSMGRSHRRVRCRRQVGCQRPVRFQRPVPSQQPVRCQRPAQCHWPVRSQRSLPPQGPVGFQRPVPCW